MLPMELSEYAYTIPVKNIVIIANVHSIEFLGLTSP
jgi:hypothetical protein